MKVWALIVKEWDPQHWNMDIREDPEEAGEIEKGCDPPLPALLLPPLIAPA
jgi:hypothetical protein